MNQLSQAFQQGTTKLQESDKQQRLNNFTKKAYKTLVPEFATDINKIFADTSIEDKVAEAKSYLPQLFSVFVVNERVDLEKILAPSFYKTSIWKTFVQEIDFNNDFFPVVLFKVTGLKIWVLTLYPSKITTAKQRILIPAKDQHPDLQLLSLELYMKENNDG